MRLLTLSRYLSHVAAAIIQHIERIQTFVARRLGQSKKYNASQKQSFKDCISFLDVAILGASATQWFAIGLSKARKKRLSASFQYANVTSTAVHRLIAPFPSDKQGTSSTVQYARASPQPATAAFHAALNPRGAILRRAQCGDLNRWSSDARRVRFLHGDTGRVRSRCRRKGHQGCTEGVGSNWQTRCENGSMH